MNGSVLQRRGVFRRAACLTLGVTFILCAVASPAFAEEQYESSTHTDVGGGGLIPTTGQRREADATVDPSAGQLMVSAEIRPDSVVAATMVFSNSAYAGARLSRRFPNVSPGRYRASFSITDIQVERHRNDVAPAWNARAFANWGADITYYEGFGPSSGHSWSVSEFALIERWDEELAIREPVSLKLSIDLFTEVDANGFASARTRAAVRATEISLTRIGDLEEPS